MAINLMLAFTPFCFRIMPYFDLFYRPKAAGKTGQKTGMIFRLVARILGSQVFVPYQLIGG